MAKTLDFTKTKKQYLTVKLNDDENTVLAVNTPTKAIYEVLFECYGKLNEVENVKDVETLTDVISALYEACAMAISNNKNRKHFTASDLEDLFDFDDLVLFFTTYMDFVGEVANTKN